MILIFGNYFTLPLRAECRLMDLQKAIQLPIIETWLGLLLGDFKLEQRGEFYDSSGVWITGSW
ncbi:hypothetical protein [Pseudanabaena sp. SR411]|uniref:hypothetical protein n=1 Tax=Pseudanabaena sp. SR411 TaxID=1980935 RepID=UPI001594FE93|nr:hypothetical protein [Pseudanabaena sp. SR411]